MVDEKLVKEIADPIIEQLEKIGKQLGANQILQIPKIRILMDSEMEPIQFGDITVDAELLRAVEEYIQEELEMMNIPTTLH